MRDTTNLRTGLSTGSCATAATIAALWMLLGHDAPRRVAIQLPHDGLRYLDVARVISGRKNVTAYVIKDGGDDPDATNGCMICSTVQLNGTHSDVRFYGGQGVGRVTLPGLGLEIGEPAINPVPRQMITQNIRQYYKGGVDVTISVPDGERIALRTFNAKVGVVNGISILGTSGIVHPFSSEAYLDSIQREMEVALAMGITRIVLNSGKRSEFTIREHYPDLPEQAYIHYGNFIGEALRKAEALHVPCVTLGVMIGKAVKLAAGFDNTHSHQVTMDREFVTQLALKVGCSKKTVSLIQDINMARQLLTDIPSEDFKKLSFIIEQLCLQTCQRIYHGNLEFRLLTNL